MAVSTPREFWLLALHTLPGVRMARVARILEVLRRERREPGEVFQASPEVWREVFELPSTVVDFLRHQRDRHLARTRALWDWLQRQGGWIVTQDDPAYPPEFRTLPYRVPLLYGVGPRELWGHRPRVAFLNSRFLREEVAGVLREAAAAVLREMRVSVVTSPLRAAYRACAEEAVRARCPVILVGDRGLRTLLASRWLQRLGGRWLLVTPSAPDDVGTPGSGMVRDDLIGCLADVLVGFEIFAGGNMERQFLRGLEAGKTVLVWQRRGPDLANPLLIRRGAASFRQQEELVARLRDELGL